MKYEIHFLVPNLNNSNRALFKETLLKSILQAYYCSISFE